MSQISRPFQIMLLVVGVLALVWLFALQGHSNSSTSTPTAAPVVSAAAPAAPSAAAQAKAAAAPSSVYHGAAPGVEGLTRAINNAHKAVATSQGYANKIEQKSNQASDQPAGTTTGAASAPHTTSSSPSVTVVHTASTPAKATTNKRASTPVTSPVTTHKPATSKALAPRSTTKLHSSSAPVTHSATKPTGSAANSSSKAAVPAGQRTVEAQLSRGNVVALLFWNPQNPADTAVHQELQLLLKVHSSTQAYMNQAEVQGLVKDFGSGLHKKIALDEASASQVSDYGAITHGIQVYNTPTLLIINKQGKTIVMNGVQDIYSIEQTIEEARNS
jgi:hypothetical protein